MNNNLRIRTNSVLHWIDCIWINWEPTAHMIARNDRIIYCLQRIYDNGR